MPSVWLVKASSDNNERYETAIKNLNHKVCSVAALSFRFINEESLKDSLNRPMDHSGIILTSPRAVEALERIYKSLTASTHLAWKQKKIFAVGETTAKLAFEKLDLKCQGQASSNSQSLAQYIIKEIEAFDKPLLFPCGNLRKEDLPSILAANDRDFRAITCYETSADPKLKSNLESAVAQTGSPSVMVFFSPSGVEHTAPLLPKVGVDVNSVKFVALGPSTNAALVKEKLAVGGVCSSPSPESVVHVIKGLF